MVHLVTAVVSFLVTTLLCPLVQMLAERIGAVDLPGGRKIHEGIVTRLGGLGIWLGVWTGLVIQGTLGGQATLQSLGAFFLGSTLLVAVGVFDDARGASAMVKFPFQIAAGIVAYLGGAQFSLANCLAHWAGLDIAPGFLACVDGLMTLFWLVGITNAINFIDGLDALALTQAACATLGMFLLALTTGKPAAALVLLAILSSMVAFSPFNKPPARMFLGDTGSTFLGFSIGMWSLIVCHGPESSLGMRLAPIALLLIPILDTLCAIVRRTVAGVSMFQADAAHIHHRLLALDYTPTQAVLILAVYALGLMGLAILVASASDAQALFALLMTVLFSASLVTNLGLGRPTEGKCGSHGCAESSVPSSGSASRLF